MRAKKSTHSNTSKGKRDLAEIKELLGPLAARYTEGQLDQLSRELTVVATLLLDLYFRKQGVREHYAPFDTGPDKR